MYEKEKQRATHLMILLCYTILTIALIGESVLMGWETWAVVLLILGLVACWTIHITGKIPASISLWLYYIVTMVTFFFYGIHETSIYDMAPLMILLIILYSSMEMESLVNLSIATYYLTMAYDLLFVLGGFIDLDALTIARILLHLALVYLSGYLAKIAIRRRSIERAGTESKIAELEEINRRTEDFLTNVSHELRTPINAVTGITTVMLKYEENADKRKDIKAVQSAGNRLFCQIEDILDYTEIDTGRIKIVEDTYMISSIVNDIISGQRIWEKENAPEIIFDIDAQLPAVLLGDGRKIKKILKHLVDNAVKFTKRGGIYVRIYGIPKPYGINLCIRISDTGIGIPAANIKKITEKFYQSSDRGKHRVGGLGLGLSIVYGMVSSLEGFIQIESVVEKGTTVSVSIPQKVSDGATGMAIENRESLCLACFLRPEKYEVPEVREYYNEMINNLVHELNVTLHRAYDMDELYKLASMYQLTHLFIGKEEYKENREYFEALCLNTEVILFADHAFALPVSSRLRLVRKPFDSLTIVNILNANHTAVEEGLHEKRMICPNIRILVVDDEPMNLLVAKGIFKEYQMRVTTASSGKEAIALCEKEDFDLVFLDHMMPEMDGVETLRMLRKMLKDSGRVFTVIAFTANAVSSAREMFRQEGFDEFLAKPIETTELERVLRKVLPKSAIAYVDERQCKKSPEKLSKIERKTGSGEKLSQGEKGKEEEKAVLEAEESEVYQLQEKASVTSQLTQLENAGFHIESALQYCSGEKEFYIELLTKFAQDAALKEKEIVRFYEQKDCDNYRILVHALKSNARMVGADSLSEEAKGAEEAARNHDVDYITAHHDTLLAQYRSAVQHIRETLGLAENTSAQEESCTEVVREELIGKLVELKNSFDAFDAAKAENLIQELVHYSYQGTPVAELLLAVQNAIENFEFDAACAKVQALISSMEDSGQEV